MKQHVRRAAFAVLITTIVVLPSFLYPLFFHIGGRWSPWQWPRPLQMLAQALAPLSWFGLPAMFILSALGDRRGPDGLPGLWEMIVVTALLWWAVLEVLAFRRSRLRSREPVNPSTPSS